MDGWMVQLITAGLESKELLRWLPFDELFFFQLATGAKREVLGPIRGSIRKDATVESAMNQTT